MMRTFGSVVESGIAAPDLQTESPTDWFAGAPLHVVAYEPSSSHVVPNGQHVCWFGQHTAFSYGQQPSRFEEYAAAQTEPTWHTWPPGPGAGVGGGGGGELQFAQRQPEMYASAPGTGEGRLPASLSFSEQVVGGA